jgi:probable phosphoglycerate mutase
MTTILLIRHGENEYVKTGRLAGRLAGVHLNEKGQDQAQKLAEALGEAPITAVYSSPLDRTMETAAPLAKALDLEVIPRSGLLELDMGRWQDRKIKKLAKKKSWSTVQNRPSMFRFPGGETFNEAQQRIVADLDAIRRLHDPKEIVACFGHSDMIKLALSFFLGQHIDLFQRIMIAPASISTLHLGKDRAMIVNMNARTSFSFPKPPADQKENTDDKASEEDGSDSPDP